METRHERLPEQSELPPFDAEEQPVFSEPSLQLTEGRTPSLRQKNPISKTEPWWRAEASHLLSCRPELECRWIRKWRTTHQHTCIPLLEAETQPEPRGSSQPVCYWEPWPLTKGNILSPHLVFWGLYWSRLEVLTESSNNEWFKVIDSTGLHKP